MNNHDPNAGARRRRSDRYADPLQNEPSMSAPSPMPGKPAMTYAKPQQQPIQPQAEWYPPQEQSMPPAPRGWTSGQPQMRQGYVSYPTQGYQQPSQGIPAQAPVQYGAWQQGYSPAPQTYQSPPGRGWTQPYPVQNQSQNTWQGGYAVNQWNGNGYTPVYEEDGNKGGSGGGKSGNDHASRIKLIVAAAVILAALVLVVGLVSHQSRLNAIYAEVSAYDNLYCQGVYVDGIHLGGMTVEEARAAVQKSAQLKCDEWNVALMTPEGVYLGEINSYHLGMTVHVDDALEEAWKQGHAGLDASSRKKEMDALLETPFHVSTALPSSDTATIDQILDEIAQKEYVPAQNANFKFEPAVNLGTPFKIEGEVIGKALNVESIKEQVYDMVSRMESGVITIEPTPIYPSITSADVAAKTTLIATAYTRISSTSEEGRNLNIERACDLINGTIIEPGQTFSFNKIVGPRTKDNGFHKAIEYAYKQQVEGYGGGVCQVSSTLYWAAVRANLEIVKREQHSLEVGYTKFGYDATVNYDGKKIDFVFRNNTDSPIYIITKVMLKTKIDKKHYLVICDIYGAAPEPGVTYDIVAVETQVPIPEATIVPDTKAQHVVYVDDPPYTVPGSVGYEVDSYKVKYVNGEEVERTFLYHDTYAAVQPITYVGVSERPLPTIEP